MPQHLIIFDLDNTLVISKPAAKEAYKQALYYLANQSGQAHSKDKLYNHWKRIVSKLKTKSDPEKREFRYSLSLLMSESGIADSYLSPTLKFFDKEYYRRLTGQSGAKETLSDLKEAGHLIAVATASATSQAKRKLKVAGLSDFIDILITANDVAKMKPDPTYYELAMKEAGISSDRVIVVGDSLNDDIKPAEKLGLKTIHIPVTVYHLGEVKEKLKEHLDDSK